MIDTAIVLAAGQGTRLRPLTDDSPKALVPLHGRGLLEWQLQTLRNAGLRKIVVVGGYLADSLRLPGVELVTNTRFAETNMVRSLLEAKEHFGDGFVLTYGDIVYEPHVIESVLESEAPITCAVDSEWRGYWMQRFVDPLEDAESLRLDGDRLAEIGQPPASLDSIEGQFVGIVGFQGEGVAQLSEVTDDAEVLQAAGRSLPSRPRPLDGMYTTDLLQSLIERGSAPHAARVRSGWLEVDSVSDLELAACLSRPADWGLRIEREPQAALPRPVRREIRTQA